jgi:hypothetical protein
MKVFMWVVFVIALASAGAGMVEGLEISTNPKATVWQEISFRLQVGLSLIVAVLSGGFAALLGRMEPVSTTADNREERSDVTTTAAPNAGREALAKRLGVTLPTEVETAAELAKNTRSKAGSATVGEPAGKVF